MIELVLFRMSQVPKPHAPLTLLLCQRMLRLVPLLLPVISLQPFLLSAIFTGFDVRFEEILHIFYKPQTVTHNVNCSLQAALQ